MKFVKDIIKFTCNHFDIVLKRYLMILTRLRSRNHHHANPLKVTKMWIGKCKIVRTKNDGESDETMVHMMADHNHKRMVILKLVWTMV